MGRLAPAHQKVLDTKAVLDARIATLDHLILHAEHLALDGAERVRLVKRRHFAARYSTVLAQRAEALAQEAADFPITQLQV